MTTNNSRSLRGALATTPLIMTLGMLAANVPVVYAGSWLLQKISLDWARRVACAVFILLGIFTILSAS